MAKSRVDQCLDPQEEVENSANGRHDHERAMPPRERFGVHGEVHRLPALA